LETVHTLDSQHIHHGSQTAVLHNPLHCVEWIRSPIKMKVKIKTPRKNECNPHRFFAHNSNDRPNVDFCLRKVTSKKKLYSGRTKDYDPIKLNQHLIVT
jgi:hypothetical protein